MVYASDEDREGEAISWHLNEEVKLDWKKTKNVFSWNHEKRPFKSNENPVKLIII
jgi:DNA topoisomerase-1